MGKKVTVGTSTVIIYATIPEDVAAYVIPDSEISEEQRGLIEDAHNKLSNSGEENAGTQFLSDAFCEKAAYCSDGCRAEWRTVWAKYKRDFAGGPIAVPVSKIYYGGFVL